MEVSAINGMEKTNVNVKQNNSYMTNSLKFISKIEEPSVSGTEAEPKKATKLGIENLQEFTIFPKEIIDGKMVIKA